jgi:hypothetical protein
MENHELYRSPVPAPRVQQSLLGGVGAMLGVFGVLVLAGLCWALGAFGGLR